MPDAILIDSLEVETCIGVPDEERASPQRLTLNIALTPRTPLTDLRDRIERTVDYAGVCVMVREIAARNPRRLLETLAEDVAAGLLARFPVAAVEVEARKFVVPGTAFVAVRVERSIR